MEHIKAKLLAELDAWKNGEREWNVANQFDETVLENAIENFDDAIEAVAEDFPLDNMTAIEVAHLLSDFEAPEIDGAWVN